MNSKNAKGVEYVCDSCGGVVQVTGSFKEAWTAAKATGWRTFKNDKDQWQHKCPECCRKPREQAPPSEPGELQDDDLDAVPF